MRKQRFQRLVEQLVMLRKEVAALDEAQAEEVFARVKAGRKLRRRAGWQGISEDPRGFGQFVEPDDDEPSVSPLEGMYWMTRDYAEQAPESPAD